MEKLNAYEMIRYLIDNSLITLEEIADVEKKRDITQFEFGLRTAHVEILEIIESFWDSAKAEGLDWDIEERFPV